MAGQAPSPPVPTSPVISVPGQDPAADLATLQSQLADLRVQQAGLQAQWDGLRSQLESMLRSNPARPGVQQAWADVGVQLAKVKGDIARLEAQIARQEGRPIGTPTTRPPGFPPRSFDPNVAFPSALAIFAVLAIVVLTTWARRIGRRDVRPASLPPDHLARLERMEHAIDAVAIEVERISEGQRFVTRILAEQPPLRKPAQSSSAPSSAAAPLALGAGPMEEIRVPERERARQPIITPS